MENKQRFWNKKRVVPERWRRIYEVVGGIFIRGLLVYYAGISVWNFQEVIEKTDFSKLLDGASLVELFISGFWSFLILFIAVYALLFKVIRSRVPRVERVLTSSLNVMMGIFTALLIFILIVKVANLFDEPPEKEELPTFSMPEENNLEASQKRYEKQQRAIENAELIFYEKNGETKIKLVPKDEEDAKYLPDIKFQK